MLLIPDPLLVPKQPTEVVREALHLTDAEALLATTLFAGGTLRRAADELRVSINTCKSQLKSIYAKTGCRNQADLVKTVFAAALGSAASAAFGVNGRV
jgi:DNA-binding CsgD family transcriptional regulator